jgi:EAL domain-containing protein (putative c-di-GMP-specific phosphodiesterase class I)
MMMSWLIGESRSPLGFRGRIVAAAAAGAAVPLATLAASIGTPLAHPGATLAATAVVAAWFLFCVSRLLSPIRNVARALDACATGATLPKSAESADQPDDEIGHMLAAIRNVAEQLNAVPRPAASQANNPFGLKANAGAGGHLSIEREVRLAIEHQQFELHYQPVVDLARGRLAGAEALVRWRHPERGLIPPASFVPVLEENGLMGEVGLWIVDAACRQAAEWRDRGMTSFTMAVNLSARQLHDPSLKSSIMGTLERHQLPPDSLELELTETAAIEDMDRTLALFRALHELGVSLAIDDFGSGHASLRYVKNLPFDKLKIDREFVADVNSKRDSRAICRALVELTRGLEIRVLAKGVETREEVETLRGLGCSMFQGFYFARPLAGNDFVATVSDAAWTELLASPVHRELAGLKNRIAQ